MNQENRYCRSCTHQDRCEKVNPGDGRCPEFVHWVEAIRARRDRQANVRDSKRGDRDWQNARANVGQGNSR